MELRIGSTNPAKIRQLALALEPCGVIVRGLTGTRGLPDVAEDHADAEGNARAKATAFAVALDGACLAMDASLFLPDLPADLQPGVNVRRLPGSLGRPGDDEVLAYYGDLCRRQGGKLAVHWVFGYAIGLTDGRCFSDTSSIRRSMVYPPCPERRPGYPLDSLQRDPRTRRRLAQLTGAQEAALWQHTIGVPLQTFVTTTVRRLTAAAEPGSGMPCTRVRTNCADDFGN